MMGCSMYSVLFSTAPDPMAFLVLPPPFVRVPAWDSTAIPDRTTTPLQPTPRPALSRKPIDGQTVAAECFWVAAAPSLQGGK